VLALYNHYDMSNLQAVDLFINPDLLNKYVAQISDIYSIIITTAAILSCYFRLFYGIYVVMFTFCISRSLRHRVVSLPVVGPNYPYDWVCGIYFLRELPLGHVSSLFIYLKPSKLSNRLSPH